MTSFKTPIIILNKSVLRVFLEYIHEFNIWRNNRANAPQLPHSAGISYFLCVIGSIYLFKKVNSPFYVGLWSSIMLRITVVLIGER